MTVYEQISCICLHTNEGRKSKNKGFSVEYASKFLELFSVEKSAHYTRVNMVCCHGNKTGILWYSGVHIVESCWKESSIFDTNCLRYLFSSQLIKIWLSL